MCGGGGGGGGGGGYPSEAAISTVISFNSKGQPWRLALSQHRISLTQKAGCNDNGQTVHAVLIVYRSEFLD